MPSHETERLLLLQLPYGDASAPDREAARLAAILRSAGRACDVVDLSVATRESAGAEAFDAARVALRATLVANRDSVHARLHAEDSSGVAALLDDSTQRATAAIDWTRYAMVRLPLGEYDALASFALATWLRAQQREVRVVFGLPRELEELAPRVRNAFPAAEVWVDGAAPWGTRPHDAIVPDYSDASASRLTIDCSDASRALDELLELARRYQVVDFTLRSLDLESDAAIAMLDELARLRREHYYAWTLSCTLDCAIDIERAERLRNAGVVRVQLDPARFGDEPLRSRGFEHANLKQLECVRALDDRGISVEWSLVCDLPEETEESYAVVAAWAAAAVHLPAPRGLASIPALLPPEHDDPIDAGDALPAGFVRIPRRAAGDAPSRAVLEEAIAAWQQRYSPRMLTYGRGPDFLRILDRRTRPSDWTFIELNAGQAAIYGACERPRSYDEIAAPLPPPATPSLRRLLDVLVERRLICRTSDDHYLALPVRRRLEEMWTTGDHAA